MDPRLAELWLRMTADALRGGNDAQHALGALGQSQLTPAALEAWIKLWLPQAAPPSGAAAAQVADFHALVEDWWRVLGVVPRHRYDELNERCRELTRRLEEAEKTVQRLRRALGEQDVAEAEDMLEAWEDLTERTLAAQSEWTRRWLDAWKTAPGAPDDSSEPGKGS
jgi:hypothetical protein